LRFCGSVELRFRKEEEKEAEKDNADNTGYLSSQQTDAKASNQKNLGSPGVLPKNAIAN
jgi:hypothetical protein